MANASAEPEHAVAADEHERQHDVEHVLARR